MSTSQRNALPSDRGGEPAAPPRHEVGLPAWAVGRPWLALVVASMIYGAIVASHWNEGYLDFGDGNYLYLSRRLAQGATLYRDLLAPQPPMHFLFGWLLAETTQALALPPLVLFRSFSLGLHLMAMALTSALAWSTARMAGQEKPANTAALAGILYLALPIGFWWGLGYQSEPLEICFLYGALLVLVSGSSARRAALAGALAALATLTNMTAAPYAVAFCLWVALRRRAEAGIYAGTLLGLWALVAVATEWATGAFFENVIFNQVGSFPRKEFLPTGENLFSYAWGKILREGRDVLVLEGGFVVLALVGLSHYVRIAPPKAETELLAWGTLALLGSIVYVSKGGTMDYIFTLGEPAVAVFAAWALRECRGVSKAGLGPAARWANTAWAARSVAMVALILVTTAPGLGFIRKTLRQQTYELDAYRTRQVVELIRKHTTPQDVILAPPFYAFLAERKIAEDYSEIFLWTLKYYNELQDGRPGRGVATVQRLTQALENKRIAFVALDLDQTGRIPPIASAIATHYRPLRQSEFRTLNTRLQFYVPK